MNKKQLFILGLTSASILMANSAVHADDVTLPVGDTVTSGPVIENGGTSTVLPGPDTGGQVDPSQPGTDIGGQVDPSQPQPGAETSDETEPTKQK